MKFITLLATVFLLGSQTLRAQNTQKIDELLKTYHENNLFDGAILISKGDSIIYEGGFGYASIEYDIPNDPETKFRIASITKIFTATLVLQLIEEGQVDYNDAIGEYLPNLNPELGEQVKIAHLLNHSSGLEREYFKTDPLPGTEFSTLGLVKAVNENTRLLFNPGDSLAYSNAGYVLLAGLIETVTKKHYRDALQERIFAPLGMENSGYESSEQEVITDLATGYRLRLGTYVNPKPVGVSSIRGNGGIYSTVQDLFVFDRALKTGKLISKDSYGSMFEKSFDNTSFAMQWQVFDSIDGYPKTTYKYAMARGASPTGFRTQWLTEVNGDFSIFILSNLDYCPRREIAGNILQLLYDNEVALPENSVAQQVIEMLNNKGTESAIAFLTQLYETNKQDVEIAINQLIELGFHSIRAGEPTASIDLFLVSNELFSDNPSVMTCLSYGYLSSGEFEKSKEWIDKVLEISPGNSDTDEIMEELKYFGY